MLILIHHGFYLFKLLFSDYYRVSSVSWYLLALFGTQELVSLFCDTCVTNGFYLFEMLIYIDMNPFMPTNPIPSSNDINPAVFKVFFCNLLFYFN